MFTIKKSMKIYIPLILCLAIFWASYPVAADSPKQEDPYSIKIGTEYIFIMASRSEFERGLFLSTTGKPYSKAGLYFDNGSVDIIWDVNFYIHEQDLYILKDGIHFARKTNWPGKGSFDQMAVQFYKNGELIKNYMISDLLKNKSKIVESVSHFMWLNDDYQENDELHLKTIDNHYYIFDIKSGDITNHERIKENSLTEQDNNKDMELLSKEKGIPIIYYSILGLLILVAIVSTNYFIRRIKDEKKKDS